MSRKPMRTLWCAALTALAALTGQIGTSHQAEAGWTGCYGGVAAGYSSVLSDASLDATGFGTIASVDSLGAQGASMTGMVGCDVQIGPDFVFGAFGNYTWDDAEFSVTVTGAPADLVSVELENRWDFGLRLGYLVTDQTLVYALAGYSQAQLSDIRLPALSMSLPTDDLTGWLVGAGAEMALVDNLFLQASYTFTRYDTERVALGGPLFLDLDTDVQTGRLGLLYRFNFARDERPVSYPPLK